MKTWLVVLSTVLIMPDAASARADVVRDCNALVDFLSDVVGARQDTAGNPNRRQVMKQKRREGSRAGIPGRPYEDIIRSAAQAHGVDPELIHAIVQEESGYDPLAVGAAGERGLMQLMPGTAKLVGCHRPFSPRDNVWGGTKYLTTLLREFRGNLRKAVAAFNCGPERVRSSRIPASTRGYVRRVLERYEMARRVQ